MNLEIENQNIVTIENELFNQLERMLINNFSNCSMALPSTNNFYSPFILALIGIFLNQTKHKRIESLLIKIENKLNETPNNAGIYNFYGNDKYFYDVDTTSIVNTFFLLRNCKSSEYHNRILKSLLNNKINGDKAIQTWINRPRNNIDWFVNYNFFAYSYLLNRPNQLIREYLISEKEKFLQTGSHYYSDISFPYFLIEFNNIEFETDLSINEKLICNDNTNLFHIGVNILDGKLTQITLEIFLFLLNSNQLYFNSKKGYFTSQELNSAIILYLINKIQNNE